MYYDISFGKFKDKEQSDDKKQLENLLEACFKSTMRADNIDMKKILYEFVADDLVINSTSVFKNNQMK